MSFGYNGRFLNVNLNTQKISIEELDDLIYRKYMGGSALSSYLLLRDLEKGVDPLGEENILVFACSVLNGVPVPGVPRYTVASKSPLSGGFGQAEAGGFWGPEFKKAGFDAAVIKGRSDTPVYLWVKDGKAELRDASYLTGKTTGKVEEIIKDELDDQNIRIVQNGLAGENLIRYSCVMNDVTHVNGRTGMGAVMGSKNFKAIAVRGTNQISTADNEKVNEVRRWFLNNWKEQPNMYELGTPGLVQMLNNMGILPTRNFKDGEFKGYKDISGEKMVEEMLVDREGCYACPAQCKNIVKTTDKNNVEEEYGAPEYETIGAFGSLCGIDDLSAVSKANELCNKYGMDTISTGSTIAFAMECYENGIIDNEDTNGIELKFGNADAMLEMVDMIINRNGIGDVLAEGSVRAAENFGEEAKKYTITVKNQEFPMHEPRGKKSVALMYALSATGADHQVAPHDHGYSQEGLFLDKASALGILEPIDPLDLSPKKVRAFYYLQKVWSMTNTLGICNFAVGPDHAFELEMIVKLVKGVTGWNTSLWELMKVAERSEVMARHFNNREGFTPEDDALPERFFEPLGNGVLEGKALKKDELEKAIKLYYKMAGWDKDGEPTDAKLAELDLEWISNN